MFLCRRSGFLVGILGLMLFVPLLLADKEAKDERERAQKAAVVLNEIMAAPDKGIPQELMERAYAIAVLPKVVKGAFIVGGSWGKGLLSSRTAGGQWGTPSFIELSGGSIGFQIGGEASDLVLVFTEQGGVKSLLESKLKLGADASVAAGPVGRKAEAGTDAKFDSAIYSYSRSKGLFAGISLSGAVLNIDDSANRKVYGSGVTGTDILLKGTVPISPITAPFVSALKQHSPRIVK